MDATEKSQEDDSAGIIKSKDPKLLVEPQQNDPAPPIPYSTFTKAQKRLIVFLIAFAGMFSPLSSFIYYPAITSLSKDLHVSIELINLTITSYMVVFWYCTRSHWGLSRHDWTSLGVYSDLGNLLCD